MKPPSAPARSSRKPSRPAPAPAMLDAIPLPALLARADGTIVAANATLAALCGWSADTAPNRPLAALVPAEVAQTLLRPSGSQSAPGVLAAADGRALPVEWLSRPIAGEGQFLICARECARERLLEDYITGNQCFEVSAAMAGGLAHDFNNVLAAILGLAELISLRLPEDSPLQGFATRIGGSIERAKVLVRRFSQFSRKGTGVVEPQPTALILQELQPMLAAFLPGNLPLEIALAEDTPWAMADRYVLEQIVLNCANFLRTRLRNDGGRLKLASRAAAAGAGPIIEFTASGEGLVGLRLDGIFELDTRRTGNAYESGAGLFVARRLAADSGGSLEVRRTDPRTIVFALTLPKAEE